jgi:amidase
MSTLPAELWKWDAADLAAGIRTRAISSREAVAACLDRINRVNPKLNAVVLTLADSALDAAAAADQAVARREPLGILHGVPITTKLNADQSGLPNSSGVLAYRDRVAAGDNAAIANLKKAGAIVIGRTNTPPFCLRWMTENELHGRTLNPWSAEHVPGGSTGGGAAAVAAGMGPLAQGSDNGGSIRYPAFCTGIAGLRPSLGRVPSYNPSQDERTLSSQLIAVTGPLARRIRDLRIGLAAMAERDVRDGFWAPVPLTGPPLSRPIKVAVIRDPIGNGVHPSVAGSLELAARILENSGYVIETPLLPSVTEAHEVWDLICQGELREYLADTVAELADAPMKQAIRYMMARIPPMSLAEYLGLYARRATMVREWSVLLEQYPVLLAPVSTRPQFIHGEDILSQEANDESYRAQSTLTAFALIGIPGVVVPTGVLHGLPTGVLVMAQRFREDVALDAAQIIEAHCPMPTPIDPRF